MMSCPVPLLSSSLCAIICLCQIWWQSDHFSCCNALLPVSEGHFLSQKVNSGFIMSLPSCQSLTPRDSEGTCQVLWQSDHFPSYAASLPVLGVIFCPKRSLPILRCHFLDSYLLPKVSIYAYATFGGNRTLTLARRPHFLFWRIASCLKRSLPVFGCHFQHRYLFFWVSLNICTKFCDNWTIPLPLRPSFWSIKVIFGLWRHLRFREVTSGHCNSLPQ